MTEDFNNPAHYQINGQDSMQLIINLVAEIADDTEETVYLFNIFKYLIRHKKKNKVEDLLKAKDYLNRLIECEECEGKKMKTVFVVTLYYVRAKKETIQAIYDNEESAKRFCQLAEGEKPNSSCYCRYKEWSVQK